jgi:uncharacterized membrane protein YbjE (DUF340 family)
VIALEVLPIFIALFAGLLFQYGFISSWLVRYEDRLIQWITILILAAMGYEIGSIPNIFSQLLSVGKIVLVFVGLTFIVSISLYYLYFNVSNRFSKKGKAEKLVYVKQSKLKMLTDSFLYLSAVILGFFLAITLNYKITQIDFIVNFILYILLFIIGQQLRQQEVKLKQIFINARALKIALVSMGASWVAGLIAAMFLGLSWNMGLAMSSGFGWYSLSGILVGQLGQPEMGAAVFFIDLLREMLAVLFIPMLVRVNTELPIGYSGATAMDFTLPVLKNVLPKKDIILCIVSGFILSMATPIFIPIWMSF